MPQIITLDASSPEIQYLCARDKRLARIIHIIGPLTYRPHEEDPYSFFIHEIIEQMMSVKAARRINERLEEKCGGRVTIERICALSGSDIRSTGTSVAKVEYIRNVTQAFSSGYWDFEKIKEMADEDIISLLTSVRGIGNWTAKMCLMFVLNRPNILPFEDGAFLQVYRWLYNTDDCTEKSVTQRCKKWSPYSTIASRFFYKALDTGLTKNEFHLYKPIGGKNGY